MKNNRQYHALMRDITKIGIEFGINYFFFFFENVARIFKKKPAKRDRLLMTQETQPIDS